MKYRGFVIQSNVLLYGKVEKMTTTIHIVPIKQEALTALELAQTDVERRTIKQQICSDYERKYNRRISAFSYNAGQATAAIHFID